MVKNSFGWCLGFVVLAACGGQSESDGSGGKSGAGGTATGGSSATGGAGASGGSGGSGAVDGGSGGTGDLPAGGFGGSVGGAPGGGGAPCTELAKAYTQTLVAAKECNPFSDMNECTQPVPDELMCPCGPTFVNPNNSQAMKTLNELQAQWQAQNCSWGVGCPAIACESPAGGGCQPSANGGSGTCQDMFTNGGG